jgi:hypothetical protein
MWHVDHLIKVDALSALLAIGTSDGSYSAWVTGGAAGAGSAGCAAAA